MKIREMLTILLHVGGIDQLVKPFGLTGNHFQIWYTRRDVTSYVDEIQLEIMLIPESRGPQEAKVMTAKII